MFGRQNLAPNNPPGMEVVPIKQRPEGADGSPMAQRQIVRVYFIGYRLLKSPGIDPKTKHLPPEEQVALPATISPIITVRGRAMKMPAIGEMFEVDELLARNLERRLRTWHPKTGEVYEGLTYSRDVAKAVKEAFERGDTENLKFSSMNVMAKLVEVTDDDLIAEIERRSAARAAAEAAPADGDEADKPKRKKQQDEPPVSEKVQVTE